MDEKKKYNKLILIIIFFLFIFVIYFTFIFNINSESYIYNKTTPILCYRECKNKIKCKLINNSYKCSYCNINNTTFDNYGVKTVYCF